MLKRLRKAHGKRGGLRYLVVMEAHKSNLPHYHILLHEVFTDYPMRKALLRPAWRFGFSHWKLADEKAAPYVAKYLAKSAQARIRASIDYGNPLTSLDTDKLTK